MNEKIIILNDILQLNRFTKQSSTSIKLIKFRVLDLGNKHRTLMAAGCIRKSNLQFKVM